jgi:hypothetical protein
LRKRTEIKWRKIVNFAEGKRPIFHLQMLGMGSWHCYGDCDRSVCSNWSANKATKRKMKSIFSRQLWITMLALDAYYPHSEMRRSFEPGIRDVERN